MSVAKTLYGTPRTIPETGETDWGAEVTSVLDDLIDGAEGSTTLLSSVAILYLNGTTTSLAGNSALDATHVLHEVSGSGGAVVLNLTTSINAGSKNGQLLFLQGTDATNTVTIRHNSNTQMNGDVILGLNDLIAFRWDSTRADWIELFRSS